jgi:acid phosphatase
MENTLILLTFDENESKAKPNKPFTILLGGVVPDSLKGTTDNAFYNHYSTISSVSVNWGLPSLGRWDCNANVFQIVAHKTGYVNYEVDTKHLFFNASYPGPLSDTKYIPIWPAPDTSAKCAAGRGVLQTVVDTWFQSPPTYNYSSPYPYDAANGINTAGSATRPSSASPGSSSSASASASASASSLSATSSSTASATSSSSSAANYSSAASFFTTVSTLFLGFLTGLAAFII